MPDVRRAGEEMPLPDGIAVVIPAAGSGLRMGLPRPKQFLLVCGTPVLGLTLMSFQQSPLIAAIFVVVPATDIEFTEREIVERLDLSKVKKVVAGGQRRQDSVRLGLRATGGLYPRVIVHDGARPLVDQVTIAELIKAGMEWRAVTVGYPATDTVKEVDRSGFVIKTLERDRLWLIQTPQLFLYEDIMEAHERALREGWQDFTDDSSMLEMMGIGVKVIKGPEDNLKITAPGHLDLMEFTITRRRVGSQWHPTRI